MCDICIAISRELDILEWLKKFFFGKQLQQQLLTSLMLLTDLFELDKDAYAWLSAKVPSEWSRSHFSTLPKCDILLNNQCEVFSMFILDSREKPIVKPLETIRNLLMTRINPNREKAGKWNLNDICPTIKKKLAKTMKKAANYIPKRSNMWNYEVIGPVKGNNWVVDLYNRTCNCRQ